MKTKTVWLFLITEASEIYNTELECQRCAGTPDIRSWEA